MGHFFYFAHYLYTFIIIIGTNLEFAFINVFELNKEGDTHTERERGREREDLHIKFRFNGIKKQKKNNEN